MLSTGAACSVTGAAAAGAALAALGFAADVAGFALLFSVFEVVIETSNLCFSAVFEPSAGGLR